jgi:hypothetical protein
MKKARGLNKNLRMVPHHILHNKGGEDKCWRHVVGLIGIMIALILLRSLPPSPTLVNLVLIVRFMVVMYTIVSPYIMSFNRANPRWEMQKNPKVLARV